MFKHLSVASIWVLMREEPSEWIVEHVRSGDEAEGESYAEFCARQDRERAEDEEQRAVEASQLADYHSWKRS